MSFLTGPVLSGPVLTGAPRQETQSRHLVLVTDRTFCAGSVMGSSQKPPELKSEFSEVAGTTPTSPPRALTPAGSSLDSLIL